MKTGKYWTLLGKGSTNGLAMFWDTTESFWMKLLKAECKVNQQRNLETMVLRLEFILSMSLGLETWRPRSRSLSRDGDLRPRSQSWSQDSMLGAYACITITIICSTFNFKWVLCHQLELMQPVLWLWSRDHGLKTWVHSSSFCPGLGLLCHVGNGKWAIRTVS